jgi:hypothetical protein
VAALFALDQNFPLPIVEALNTFIPEGELVSIADIDERLTELDDWEVLLALHHHKRPWDGMITNDRGILSLPRELAVIRQTNLTLVVARAAGHDPLRATGLLFMHLSYICRETTSDRAQIWELSARNKPADDPHKFFEDIAEHQNLDVDQVVQESRLSTTDLARDPLAL